MLRLLCILAVLLASTGVSAQEPLGIVASILPPYVVDLDGVGAGPGIRLVEQLARWNEIEASVTIVPFQRAVMMLDRGNAIYPGLQRTPAREHKYNWIGEIAVDRAAFFTRTGTPAAKGLDEARHLGAIAVVRGSGLHDLLILSGIGNIVAADNEAECARMLDAGRVDGWFSPLRVGHAAWTGLGFAPSALQPGDAIMQLSFWVAASRDLQPDLVEALRDAYRNLNRDG